MFASGFAASLGNVFQCANYPTTCRAEVPQVLQSSPFPVLKKGTRWAGPKTAVEDGTWDHLKMYPIGSMYGIFTYI